MMMRGTISRQSFVFVSRLQAAYAVALGWVEFLEVSMSTEFVKY